MTEYLDEAVVAHLRYVLGEPIRTAVFTYGQNEFSILKWNADQVDDGVAFYVTVGASAEIVESKNKRRVEFVLGILPEEDGIARSLAILASFPLSGKRIGRGDTVSLPDPLSQASEANTYFLLPPMEDVVPPLLLDDGTHVEFLGVMPIFESELKLKNMHSAEWLMGEFGDRGIQWWSLNRRALT